MKNKMIVLTITLLLLISGIVIAVEGKAENVGEEATDAVQEVSDWHDLDVVRDDLSGDYVLVNDLDEDTEGYMEYNDPDTAGWEPIGEGTEVDGFVGTFDGQGHEISGLYIDRPDTDYVGLFASIGRPRGGELNDLGLTEVDITGGGSTGGITGRIDCKNDHTDGLIRNSFTSGSIVGNSYVGGLVGYNSGNSDGTSPVDGVYNSYSIADVKGESYVGGLIGKHGQSWWGTGELVDSYFAGSLSGDEYVGGLVGRATGGGMTNPSIENSYWNKEITGVSEGIGLNDPGIFEGESRTTEEMTWEYEDTYEGWDFGGIWRDGDHDIVVDGQGNSGYPALEWQEEEVYNLEIYKEGQGSTDPAVGSHSYKENTEVVLTAEPDEGWYFAGWTGDASSTEEEITVTMDGHKEITAHFEDIDYRIKDWYDLDDVRDDLDGDYVLVNDLDEDTEGYDELASEDANALEDKGVWESDTSYEENDLIGYEENNYYAIKEHESSETFEEDEDYWIETDKEDGDTLGWKPLGDRESQFHGTFEGNGNEIRSLFINREDENYLGLFGGTGGSAHLRDLSFVGADLTGDRYVGGVVGYNTGDFIDVSLTGDITGYGDIGGLIGRNDGGTIYDCSSDVNVRASYRRAGGLLGKDTDGTIRGCSAAGKVEVGDFEGRGGGLVGLTQGSESLIINSRADAAVEGNEVGGLVGMTGEHGSNTRIERSYATGHVEGVRRRSGGLVGHIWGGVVSNSYAVGGVSGGDYAGGLAGVNEGTITESYAIGEVNGGSYVGGLVGFNRGGTVSDSFWDMNTTDQDDSEGGTGKITAEMKDAATFTDLSTEGLDEPWDFVDNPYDDQGDEEIWDIDENEEINDGYPFLDRKDSFFEIKITDYEREATEGEEVTVEYEVENIGEDKDTQEIEFKVDGEVEDSEEVTLPRDGYEFLWQHYEHDSTVFSVYYGEIDGREVVFSGSYDDTVMAYDYEEEEKIWQHEGHDDEVYSVDHAEVDGREVVFSGSNDNTVVAYDYEEEEKIWQHEEHDDRVYSVDHAEIDGKDVVFSGSSGDKWDDPGQVVAYDYEAKEKIWLHEEHDGIVYSVDYAEIGDKDVVFSGSDGEEWGDPGQVVAYDYEAKEKIWLHEEHTDRVRSVHHAEIDGREVVFSGSSDNTVVAYDYENERKIWQHEVHENNVRSVYHAEIGDKDVVFSGSLAFDDTVVAVEYLGKEEVHEGKFTWQTEPGDAGEHRLRVESEDDHDEVTVEVLEDTQAHTLTINEPVGEGTVKVDGDEVTGWPYKEEYDDGTEVELKAVPNEDWYFEEWTGDHTGIEEDITVTMDEDKEITAVFKEEIVEYDLTIDIEGEGSTQPEEGTHTYEEGESVTVTATPDEGLYFDGWTGDYEVGDREITMIMDDDKNLTANFDEVGDGEQVLTIKVDGEGTTDPAPGDHLYDEDEEVTVEAVAHEGWYFEGWRGDHTSEEEEITITMDEDKEITASFKEYATLTIEEIRGDGVVEIDGEVVVETPFEKNYIEGEIADLSADPAEGWYFEGWEGIDGSEADIELTMDENKEITAVFEVVEYDLMINIEGEGSTDPQEGTHTFEEGESVTVTATPDEGWYFDEWNGTDEESEEVTVLMDDDKKLTAHFEIYEYDLMIEIEGEGSTDPEEGTYTYEHGTEVTVEAIDHVDRWHFVEWTGDVPEDGREEQEIIMVMDEEKEITAHFDQVEFFTFEIDVFGEGVVEIKSEGGEDEIEVEDSYREEYRKGRVIVLEGLPEEEWYFERWSGDLEGPGREITVVLDSDKVISAHFAELVELELSVEGNGTTDPEPGRHLYRPGEVVEVEARSDPGWEFDRWEVLGDEDHSKEMTVVMNEGKEITAHFERIEPEREDEMDDDTSPEKDHEVRTISRWWLLVPLIGSLVSIGFGEWMDRKKKKN